MGVRFVSLIAVASLLIACGDSHTSVYEDHIELFEDLTELLEGVDDADSAKDAAEEIEGRFAEEGKALDAKMEELKAADPAKGKEVEKKYKPQLDALKKKLMGLMPKLMKYPELQKALSGMN